MEFNETKVELGRRTFLPVVGPVRVDRREEQFAEAGHEGDLPKDRL